LSPALLKLLFSRSVGCNVRFNLLLMIVIEAYGIIDLGEGQMRIDLLLDLLRGVTVLEPANDQPDGNPGAFDNRPTSTEVIHSNHIRMLRLGNGHAY